MAEDLAEPVQITESRSVMRQALWFPLHVAVLYFVAKVSLPWFSGWIQHSALPFLLQTPPSESNFQFLFSHLSLFSLILGFVIGSAVNPIFRHKAAQFAWVFPGVLLLYRIATFGAIHASVLAESTSHQFSLAFHYYFGQDFLIGGWGTWTEFWNLVATNPDMSRGMDQTNFTAPFCAGITYAAAWLAIRTRWNEALVKKVKEWELRKFGTETTKAQ